MEKREVAIVSGIVGILFAAVVILGAVIFFRLMPSATGPEPAPAQPPTPAPTLQNPVPGPAPAPTPVANDQALITQLVQDWAMAWGQNPVSLVQYQTFYAPDFFANYKAKTGMNYQQWMADKANKAKKVSCIQVLCQNLAVNAQGDFASASFLQTYLSNNYCDSGQKTMNLIKRDGVWKIVGEEQGAVTKCDQRCGATVPTPAPAPTPGAAPAPAPAAVSPEVNSFIAQWARAWEQNVRGMASYQNFYASDFWSNYKTHSGMNYQQWMTDKAQKAKKAVCIRIEIENLGVQAQGDFATVNFNQRYISNNFCDAGPKTMYLLNRGGAWKIVGEEQPATAACSQRCHP